jgi:hypothetical protein
MLLTVWRISVRKRGPSARVESFEEGKKAALDAAGRRRGLRRRPAARGTAVRAIRRSNRSCYGQDGLTAGLLCASLASLGRDWSSVGY